MLYLTRKPGESIVINEQVEITVVSVAGRTVKLGFNFPPGSSILRKEVFERIQAENRAAAETAVDLAVLQQVPETPAPLPPKPDCPDPESDPGEGA